MIFSHCFILPFFTAYSRSRTHPISFRSLTRTHPPRPPPGTGDIRGGRTY